MTGFLSVGFTPSDLIPVSLDLVAANMSPIKNACSIFFFFSMDIISPDLDSFRAAAVGVGV